MFDIPQQIKTGVQKFLTKYFKEQIEHSYFKEYPNLIFFLRDKNKVACVYDKNKKIIYNDIRLSYDYAKYFSISPHEFYTIQRNWLEVNFIEPVNNVTPPSMQQYIEWQNNIGLE